MNHAKVLLMTPLKQLLLFKLYFDYSDTFFIKIAVVLTVSKTCTLTFQQNRKEKQTL